MGTSTFSGAMGQIRGSGDWLSLPETPETVARMFRSVAWMRVVLTAAALTAVPFLPGLGADRVMAFVVVPAVFLPAAFVQLALSRLPRTLVLRLVSVAIDFAALGVLFVAAPRLAQGIVLAMLVLTAVHALLDLYVGGLLATGLGTALMAALALTERTPLLDSLVVSSYAMAGLATTALVGYASTGQRRVAADFGESYSQARRQLELSLEAAEMGLWEWDIEADRVEWSAGTLRIFGLSEAPADVRAFTDLVHPEDRAALEHQIGVALEQGVSYQVLHRTTVDGRTRWVLGKGRTITDASGRPVRLLGVVTDVTDQREQQLHFERSRRMETVSGLAGGFAHDFNNLLAVIMMTAEMHLRSPLDRTSRSRVETILAAARRGAALSSKLLTFARRESGHPLPVHVDALVAGLEPMLHQAVRADITLTVEVEPGLPSVMADRALFEQALLNLVVNARDAIAGAGEIRITARHGTGEDDDQIVFEVTDTGVGMTDEVRERAVEPFFTTKGPDMGTGLGLASVYSTVTAMDGRIEIDSAVGHGTSVRLVVPTCAEPAPEDPVSVADTYEGRRAHILVVEDDHEIRLALAELLQSEGHDVTVAEDGQQALEMVGDLPELQLDVIITDVVMPGMSGPELVKALQQRGRTTPVVYMTGYADQADVDNAGLAVVLHKPFTNAELTAAMSQVRATAGAPGTA